MSRAGAIASLLVPLVAGCASAPAPAPTGERAAPGSPPAAVVQLAERTGRRSPSGTAIATELVRGANAYLAIMTLEPDARIPPHQDTSEEYLYVLEGGGTLTIDGQVSLIGPGSAVFMPSMATVSYVNGPARSVVVQVFADPGSAAKYEAWTPVTAPAPRGQGPEPR